MVISIDLFQTKLRDITVGQLILLCAYLVMIALGVWAFVGVWRYVLGLILSPIFLWSEFWSPVLNTHVDTWRGLGIVLGIFVSLLASIWWLGKKLNWYFHWVALILISILGHFDDRFVPLSFILPPVMFVAYLRKKCCIVSDSGGIREFWREVTWGGTGFSLGFSAQKLCAFGCDVGSQESPVYVTKLLHQFTSLKNG